MTTENDLRPARETTILPPTVTFLGTADAFNAGGCANSCYWVHDALGQFCVDFGPTALMKANEYGRKVNDLDALFITHLHGDHIGGLPMLLLHLNYELNRTRPLYIAGPSQTAAYIEKLWRGTYPSTIDRGLPFEVRHIVWAPDQPTEVLGRSVSTMTAVHDEAAQAHSLKVNGPDYTIAFSGDTGWQPTLASFTNDVDLFICEATNVSEGYWGHMSIEEHRRHRRQLTPKRLVLSHLSSPARALAKAESSQYDWIVAHDGMQLTL
ncbi:MAG: MBL fold metallo-hydrolase [Bradymonadia bacterium]